MIKDSLKKYQKDFKVHLLIGTFIILLFSGCSIPTKNIYTQIDIDAPKEKVWMVLENINSYSTWNPYHVEVRGQLKVGEKLYVKVHKPNNKIYELEPYVYSVIPNKELIWGGGIKYIFTGEHLFKLEEISSKKTRLIQKEKFEGLVVPFAELDTIEEGYTLMNMALKKLIENNLETK